MNSEKFVSINGNEFYVENEVIKRNFCSVRETGYLIVPDGRLIVVPSGKKHHGEVFKEYLEKYLEMSSEELMKCYNITSDNGLKYIPLLNEFGLIAYFGIGLAPKSLMNGYEDSRFYEMYGMLNIPTQTDKVSLEQLYTCQELLKTNISFTGKEKYPINIGDIETGITYSVDNINQLIIERTKNYKKD